MELKQYKGYLFGEWIEKVLDHMENLGYEKPKRDDWRVFYFFDNGSVNGDTFEYAYPKFINTKRFEELTPEQFLLLKKSDVTTQDKIINNDDIYTCSIHKISWNKNDYGKDCPLCKNFFAKHNPSREWLNLNLEEGDIVKFKEPDDIESEEYLTKYQKDVLSCYGKNQKVSCLLMCGFKIEGSILGLVWDYDVIETVYRTEK